MTNTQKHSIYKSIMNDVAKTIKRKLNENDESYSPDEIEDDKEGSYSPGEYQGNYIADGFIESEFETEFEVYCNSNERKFRKYCRELLEDYKILRDDPKEARIFFDTIFKRCTEHLKKYYGIVIK